MTIYTRPAMRPRFCEDGAVGASTDPMADRNILLDSDFTAGFARNTAVPTRAYMNGLFFELSNEGLYLMQRGVPEWAADTDYPVGALVSYGAYNFYYRATAAVSSGAANPASNAVWERHGGWHMQQYTAADSYNFVVPDSCTAIYVYGVGGGGGGGGGGAISGTTWVSGGGGGGGGAQHYEGWYPIASPGTVVNVVVGTGGAGATAGGTGGAGADSSFGAWTFEGAAGGRFGESSLNGGTRGRNGGGGPSRAMSATQSFISTVDSSAMDNYLGYLVQPPGVGGMGGVAWNTSISGRTGGPMYPARCGGASRGNNGGAQGLTTISGTVYADNTGGGGGGASSIPAALGIATRGGVGGAAATSGAASAQSGLAGGGGGGGAGGGTYGGNTYVPGNSGTGGSGGPGAVVVVYRTL